MTYNCPQERESGHLLVFVVMLSSGFFFSGFFSGRVLVFFFSFNSGRREKDARRHLLHRRVSHLDKLITEVEEDVSLA